MSHILLNCARCRNTAAEISLIQEEGGPVKLVSRSFTGTLTEPLSPERAEKVRRWLELEDADAIYQYEPLWIPSYCPECARHYCGDHWSIESEEDNDMPGWHDSSYGTCPMGHRRLIDD